MPTIRSFLPLIILAAACGGQGTATRTISLSVEGAGNQMAYFDRYENGRPYHVDSVKLNGDGKGTMKVPYLPLDFYRIAVGNEQLIVVLDSAEGLVVEAQGGLLQTPMRLEGSVHTDAMRRFQEEAMGYEQKVSGLRSALSADPSNQANLDELNATNLAFYERCRQFVRENSGSPVAISVLGRMDMTREFELFKQVRDGLRRTMPNSGFYASFREQVDRYEQELVMIRAQEEEMKRLSNLLPIGSEAPEIRQSTPDGGSFALSQLRGKVVLIDFWASWCRPCRIENPNVKRVYERFRAKGFEILGVSLDRDHTAWVEAIKADGLPWKHVSDLGFWNNAAAQEYGVSSIPFTVLVDREGKVLDKGLRGDQLEARLAEVLGK
ncbi:MAG: TlpA disulfide reductase family protein [Flavobacteriales bacterium]|nr:MAG: TlpA disulfide reductase family protein [Flavobacteriales bacterium]